VAEVETEREGGVLTITLNRPDKLNAFDAAMQERLGAALATAGAEDVRAVVLTGAGRGFCVGQDLGEFRSGAGDISARLRTTFNRNVLALRALAKPVIAAVNGPAAGAGLSLACACDMRVADASATFVPAFVNVGLVPDTGGSWFVANLLGYAKAFELFASGRTLTAADAHAWGLVSEVVEAGRVLERAREHAERLGALPTRAIGLTKQLLDRAASATLEEQLEVEAELQAAAAASDDFAEGIAAFLEKREPRFAGR
jgi:2-(1,2-epoxy-1,2-dihydrophenyl)acetyl-CoA isomerase